MFSWRHERLGCNSQKLTATEAEAGDEFGSAVAIHQDTQQSSGHGKTIIPVTDSRDNALEPLQIDKGSAYSFSERWIDLGYRNAEIIASGTNRSDLFGASVANQRRVRYRWGCRQ